tara:strand:+ start:671 stop:1129 length:459 start_codon:yes stop_codon:yes gene_type:complete
MNPVQQFAKKEIKSFKSFLVKFNIIGLAIGTVIGLTLSNSTKLLSDELLIPAVENIFSINDIKLYTLKIFNININMGIILSEFIKILFIIFILFIIYSFINTYTSDIISPNYLQEEVQKVQELEQTTDYTKNIQIQILNELKKFNQKKSKEQ